MQAIANDLQPISATVKQSDLKAAWAKVSKAVSTRSTLPILSNIMIETIGDGLRLSATNLEIAMQLTIPARVEQIGATTIPAAILASFIAPMSTGDVQILPLPVQGIQIRTGSTQANIRGTAASEFPTIPSLENAAHVLNIDFATFKAMVAETAYCAYADNSRPVFTAICMRVFDDYLDFAAADTFRLAVRRVLLGEEAFVFDVDAARGEYLFPARSMQTIAGVFPEQGTVKVYLTPQKNQVFFECAGILIASHLIEGQYAAYEAIMPHETAIRVVVPREPLYDALKSSSAFQSQSQGTNTVKLVFTPAESELMPGSMTIYANNDEFGDSETTLDASIEGPGLTMLFNAHYLMQAAAAMDTPEVDLRFKSTDHSPLVIRPLGTGDIYRVCVMPLYNRG